MRIKMLLLTAIFAMTGVQANPVEVHGFAAQGVIKASDSNFVEDDQSTSLALTEAGINASYRYSPSIRFAGQAVYINGGNRYPEGARIDYLFVDWSIVNNLDWKLNAHIGRYKNYHWYYSSIRDIPHARPSIVLPQSVYFDTFRDVALGSDGVNFWLQTSREHGDWDVNWSYGTSPISDEQTQNLLSVAARGEMTQDFTHQFTVRYRAPDQNFHIGLSLLDSDFGYRASASEPLVSGDATSQRLMLMLGYNIGQVELVAELLRERVTFNGILFNGFFDRSTAEGGYVQARYHLSSDVSLLARIDIFDRDRKDRDGSKIEALSGGTIPGYFGFMDQATVGASWDIAENVRLQGEFHRVKGAGRLAPVLSPDPVLNDSKYWNMWALQIMYWF